MRKFSAYGIWLLSLLAVIPPAGADPLIDAAVSGNRDAVLAALAEGRDLNRPDRKGMTALHHAAEHGHLTVVRALLKHGADRDLKDREDRTALDLAMEYKHEAVAELLRTWGSQPTPSDEVDCD